MQKPLGKYRTTINSGVLAIMELPSIAVVIPNRNDSKYLTACLKSVTGQSIKVDQIIFVDDFSDDDSLPIAYLELSKFGGVTVISNKSQIGTMGALNLGLKQATTDYVFFLSSNDFLLTNMIEIAKPSIARFGIPGVWSAMVWAADEDGNRKYIYPSPVVALRERYFSPNECAQLAMKLGNWFTGSTMIFHRKTLESIGGFDIEYKGLADLFAAFTVSSINGAVFFPRPLAVMRKHPGGYLFGTLTDKTNFENILIKISNNSVKISTGLYTKEFITRTVSRLRYASIKASGFSENKITQPYFITPHKFLHFLSSYSKLKIVITFIYLRPFDLWPIVVYRVMGNIALRLNKYECKHSWILVKLRRIFKF